MFLVTEFENCIMNEAEIWYDHFSASSLNTSWKYVVEIKSGDTNFSIFCMLGAK